MAETSDIIRELRKEIENLSKRVIMLEHHIGVDANTHEECHGRGCEDCQYIGDQYISIDCREFPIKEDL